MLIPVILNGRRLRLPTAPFGIPFAARTTTDIRRAIESAHPELVGVPFEIAVLESESDIQDSDRAWAEFCGSFGEDEEEKQQSMRTMQDLREAEDGP